MPSFKSCLASLAILAVAFAPITAAAGHKTTDLHVGRDVHGASANAARAVGSAQVGKEKRAAAKAAAVQRALARRAKKPSKPATLQGTTASLYGPGSAFAAGKVAAAVAGSRCAKPNHCLTLPTIPNSFATCLSTRFCQLQCNPGFAPGVGGASQSCVASAATCSAATCPVVNNGFNTCSSAGQCVQGCSDTFTLHSNSGGTSFTCLNLGGDINNCGTAGTVCPSGYASGAPKCYKGKCTLTCGKSSYPMPTTSSSKPLTCSS